MKAVFLLIVRECQWILGIRLIPIILACWFFCLALWTFFGFRFFEVGEASLNGSLHIFPWFFAPLMALLAAQLWHPDLRPGYEQWLQSFGLGGIQRITAQFLAAGLVNAGFILTTVPLALTIMWMGPLDRGLWLSSLFGLWCCSMWQLALAGLCMRLFKRVSASILVSLVCLGLLQALGLRELVDQIIRLFPWIPAPYFLNISPLYHLDTLKRGIVDSVSLSYFLGGSLWFLTGQILLQRKQRTLSLRGYYVPPRMFWILLDLWLISALALVALGQKSLLRWDLSDERLYSLSEGSRAILRNIKTPVKIKLYFSSSHPSLEDLQRIHGQRVQQLLEAYADYAPEQVQIEVMDPRPDTALEAEARSEGLRGLRTSRGDIYLAAVFMSGNKTIRIPYFDPRKETQIEYELSEVLVKLNQPTKPILGVITTLPMVTEDDGDGPRLRQDWSVVEALRSFYQVTRLSVDIREIPENVKSLLVIHPKAISELTEYAIDQFVLRGGHLVVAVDPFCETELAYNNSGSPNPFKMSSTLPRLFSAWSVNFDSNHMVGDAARSGRQVTLQKVAANPFHVSPGGADMNRKHPITRTLEQTLFPEPGWLDVKTSPDRSWVILVQSSSKSGLLPTETAAYMSPQQLTQQLKPDGVIRALAGILSGSWTSAFPEKPAGSPMTQHMAKSLQENSVVLFADTDFLADNHTVEKLQVMNQMLIRPRNDNLNLLMHAVEFLGGNRDLISIHAAGSVHRPLSTLDAFDDQSQQPWLETEDKLSARITEIERQIGELHVQGENTSNILSREQQRELQRLREVEAGLWTERRLIREKARSLPNQLRRLIVMVHGVLLPTAMIGWGFRRRQQNARAWRKALKQLEKQS